MASGVENSLRAMAQIVGASTGAGSNTGLFESVVSKVNVSMELISSTMQEQAPL